MKKRVLTLLLTASLLLPVFPFSASAAEDLVVRYSHTFESCALSDKWNSNASGFGTSYNTGKWMIVNGRIKGKSLKVNTLDMRWWSVDYSDRVMGFSFDILLDEHFSNEIIFNVNSQEASTTTESPDGGRTLIVKKSGDKAVLQNYQRKTVAELELNRVYTLEAVFTKGEGTYEIRIDGETVSADNKFVSPIYRVAGMRFHITGRTDAYAILDNIRAYSYAEKTAQKNSYQEKGKLPTVKLREIPEEKPLLAVFNGKTVGIGDGGEEDGTVFLPVIETLAAGGIPAEKKENASLVSAHLGEKEVRMRPDTDYIRVGDSYLRLSRPLTEKNGILYAPLQLFSELCGAEVWYDSDNRVVLLTSGEYREEDILRMYNEKLYMNGKPYYEISFNKFDLYNQISADASFNGGKYTDRTWCDQESCLAGAEEALKQLSENGFRTIRVFCGNINLQKKQKEIDTFWKKCDTMFDLCDKYGIRVVACMSLLTGEFLDGQYAGNTWVTKNETYYDYITDPASVSRKNCEEFLKAYIGRYKDRKTVLMWEISNEGNLQADVGSGTSVCFSLLQYAAFYTEIGTLFHKYDPDRLVTSGDSMLRSAQWHLLSGTMAGTGMNWTTDNTMERRKALTLLYEALDVVSIHGYDVGYATGNGHSYYKEGIAELLCTFSFFREEAESVGKALYNGETGGMMNQSAPNNSAQAAEYRAKYLQSIVKGGVQLTHWWSFHSDRKGEFKNDNDSWNVTVDGTPETFQAIKAANAALKEKWMINAAEAENTHGMEDGEFVPYDGTGFDDAAETASAGKKGCGSSLALLPLLPVLPLFSLLLIRRKRR